MTRFYWTAGLSINSKAERPPSRALGERADQLHSWTAVIPPTDTHPLTRTHARTYANWGLNEQRLTLLCKTIKVTGSTNLSICD